MARPKKLTPLEEFSVYQYYTEKKPLAEIAYKFGISVTTVLRIVDRFKEEKNNDKK